MGVCRCASVPVAGEDGDVIRFIILLKLSALSHNITQNISNHLAIFNNLSMVYLLGWLSLARGKN